MAKTKKNEEKIVETEPIEVEEKAIINEEVPTEETVEVEAPEVKIVDTKDAKTEENASNEKQDAQVQAKKLKVEIGFNDKYTNEEHKVGDILENLTDERYNELKNDSRKLVSEM